jgi:4-amino-4-deoxychorismate lyase
MVKPQELESADGVWLASSVRGIVDVTSIDGVDLARSSTTRALQELLGFAR